MAVQLKFRHRVGLLVALAATALATVTALALMFGAQGERQLAGIETRYVPLIELDRDLKAQFAELPRALEDAATAAEDSRLHDADRVYAAMVERLRLGRHAIIDNGGDPQALERDLAAYYASAREVAAALAAGAPAGPLVPEIDQMRRTQEAVRAKLDLATAPDRRRLAAAFATARASQRDAIWTDILVGSGALALIGLLSWRFIRRTVYALQAVAIGVERLARGDFGHEIPVTTRDELGDLAREANRTAVRLREYRDKADRDAAELRHAAEELRVAYAALEDRAQEVARASRHKSEFLANMSHELRTPLNSIMVLAKVLAEDHGANDGRTEKQIEFATLIHKSGEELLGLINEVLDLSKIEAGKQELTCEPLPVADLQDYVGRMFRPLAAQKGLTFELACADDLPAVIRTDRARLTQIVKNLIANAFKFTERGGVTVRMSRTPDALVIAVADTGIGIAVDKQQWIFEAFAQADTGIARRFGGTGLGLTIARQLATRLGGDLRVVSTPGVGSEFSVVLPIAGPADTDDPTPPSRATMTLPPPSIEAPRPARGSAPPYLLGADHDQAPEPALQGKTVLVVDPDMRNVYALSNALTGTGLRVIAAADGHEALGELGGPPEVDAVLMDVTMPGPDGVEAIRQIRAQARHRALPIIALAAPGTRERCLDAGASEHVAKPVDPGHLIGLLRTSLAAQPGIVK